MQIFVLSDTHNKLPENVRALAKGAGEIWHLGDVCAPHILHEIETFGPPVYVVHGNCDENAKWPMTLDFVRNGVQFHLVHIPPEMPPPNTHVVLHGHTHVPRNEVRNGVRYLNPGCVTRPNRGAPASVARLQIDAAGKIEGCLVPLR
jgi:putative phosphoesterase